MWLLILLLEMEERSWEVRESELFWRQMEKNNFHRAFQMQEKNQTSLSQS